jgi:Cu/Ag efflux protein CusF
MRTILAAVVATLVLWAPSSARAQKAVSQSDVVEVKATIAAIDHDGRVITLQGPNGNLADLQAGPEIKRFDELKVGDTVTFRYHESVVYKIRKPGEAPAGSGTEGPTVVPGKGARPGGTISQQQTATVTIKAIDAKVPSLTIVTDKGHEASFRVEDKNNIKGLKVGDKVEITYTEAVLISVK